MIPIVIAFACGMCALICWQLDRAKTTERELKKAIDRLRCGHNPEIEHAILRALNGGRGNRVSKQLSAEIYKTSLDNLAVHPHNSSAKAFVFDMGRWHLRRMRGSTKTTAADDDSIHHDIVVRCRMSIPRRKVGWYECECE